MILRSVYINAALVAEFLICQALSEVGKPSGIAGH
jgi:hypothetical protein